MKKKLEKQKTNEKRKLEYTQKGITLIALVVTVIVLLILAGVSIQTIFSDNGILKTAQNAVNQQKIAEIKDRIHIVIMNWRMQKVMDPSIKLDTLWKMMEEEGIIENAATDVTKIGETDQGDIYKIVTKEGYVVEVIVDDDENVTIRDVAQGGNFAPSIGSVKANYENNSIHITVSVSHLENGKITYSYKKESDAEYTTIKSNQDLTAIIENAEPDIIYNIKIVAKNDNGQADKEINVRTGNLPSGLIKQAEGSPIWDETTHSATMKLETTEALKPGVKIQYQINGINGIWKDYPETGITPLYHEDTVYVRLTDDISYSEGDAGISVLDSLKPEDPTVQFSVSAQSKVTATVTHVDKQSGIVLANCKWILDTTGTNYDETNSIWNTATSFGSNNKIDLNIPLEDGNYYLHILSVDVAQNKKTITTGPIKVATPVAKINSTTYMTLQSAIDAVPTTNTETTIILLKSITENVVIEENQNIVLQLGSYQLESNRTTITNHGTLKVADGTIESTNSNTISNLGTLQISGTAKINGLPEALEGNNVYPTIGNKAGGTVQILGGSITSKTVAISNEENGTINIQAGTITGQVNTIINRGIVQIAGEANINNGNSTKPTIYNYATGNVDVQGGTILANNSNAINNYGTVTITKTAKIGDNTTNSSVLYNQNGANMKIQGGTITSGDNYTITNCGTLTVEEQAQIIGNGLTQYAIVNIEGAVLNANGGTILANNSGTIMNEGTLNVNETAKIESKSQVKENGKVYATIYNGSKGKTEIQGGTIIADQGLTLVNTENGDMNIQKGSVTSNSNAISNSATLKIGGTATITAKSSNHPAVSNANTGNVQIQGGTISASSSNAINNLGTVTIGGNAQISSTTGGDSPTIYNDTAAEITINSSTITAHSSIAVGNRGTCYINENVEISSLGNYVAVYNLQGATTNINGANITANGTRVVDNEGTLNIRGATQITAPNGKRAIINDENANLDIQGGTITAADANAILNDGTLTIGGSTQITSSGATTYATVHNRGSITVNAGTINHTGGGYALYNDGGTHDIQGGEISMKNF